MISGYFPLTKIGFANHPDSNCCLVSAASTWDESLKMAGSAQFMFRVIPTLPKINKQLQNVNKQLTLEKYILYLIPYLLGWQKIHSGTPCMLWHEI